MRPRSYACWTDPDRGLVEKNAFTCGHCGNVVVVDKETAFGGCRMCMKNVCAACEARGGCDPFEKQLERIERSFKFGEALGR